MKNIINQQTALYPQLCEEDVLKAVYQSVFGSNHFVYNEEKCSQLLEKELAEITVESKVSIEDLGCYSRVHLSKLKELGISPNTLLKLFVLSAKKENKTEEYIKIIKKLPELCGDIFDKKVFSDIIDKHIENGCPAFSHSDYFRERYKPAYRVIKSEYASLIPLFKEIEKHKNPIVAIDGKAASGKSTLADLLAKIYAADVIHLDDYFLPHEKKTPLRLSQAGGNADHERFLEEVLLPLSKYNKYISRPYRCHGGYYEKAVEKKRAKITVVEGSYSLYPSLCEYYDLKVFVDIDYQLQCERIKKRNPEMCHRFTDEWIPLENRYFEATKIENVCDMHLVSMQNYTISLKK